MKHSEIMGDKNSDVSSMLRRTESNFQTWNFDPIPSEICNWLDMNLQGPVKPGFLWRLGKTRDMLICRCSQQRLDHCNVDSVVNGIGCMK